MPPGDGELRYPLPDSLCLFTHSDDEDAIGARITPPTTLNLSNQ